MMFDMKGYLRRWKADGEARMEKWEEKLEMRMPFFVASEEKLESIGAAIES